MQQRNTRRPDPRCREGAGNPPMRRELDAADETRRARTFRTNQRRYEMLMELLERRRELRGLYPTADYMLEAVCWSA